MELIEVVRDLQKQAGLFGASKKAVEAATGAAKSAGRKQGAALVLGGQGVGATALYAAHKKGQQDHHQPEYY